MSEALYEGSLCVEKYSNGPATSEQLKGWRKKMCHTSPQEGEAVTLESPCNTWSGLRVSAHSWPPWALIVLRDIWARGPSVTSVPPSGEGWRE